MFLYVSDEDVCDFAIFAPESYTSVIVSFIKENKQNNSKMINKVFSRPFSRHGLALVKLQGVSLLYFLSINHFYLLLACLLGKYYIQSI